tara:strand:+ start:184 stop:324 length:141 start_codon:yes stop_codon:yes gene_type:complete
MAEKTTNKCSARTIRAHVYLMVNIDEPRNVLRNTGCPMEEKQFVAA